MLMNLHIDELLNKTLNNYRERNMMKNVLKKIKKSDGINFLGKPYINESSQEIIFKYFSYSVCQISIMVIDNFKKHHWI